MSPGEYSERVRTLYDSKGGAVVFDAFYSKRQKNPDEKILVEREQLYKCITLSDELERSLPGSLEDYRSFIVDRMLSGEDTLIEPVGDKYGLTEYGEAFLGEVHKIVIMVLF